MRATPALFGAGALLALAACAYNPMPVPVAGSADDLSVLAGEWRGEYVQDRAAGRRGSILFQLQAGRDTAYGDVLMSADEAGPFAEAGAAHDAAARRAGEAQVLAISFVRAERGWVTGRLDAYRDPVCGCHVETSFTGRIRGDRVEGTFVSIHVEGGARVAGRWYIERVIR